MDVDLFGEFRQQQNYPESVESRVQRSPASHSTHSAEAAVFRAVVYLTVICLGMLLAALLIVEMGLSNWDDRELLLWLHSRLGSWSFGFFETVSFLGGTATRIAEAMTAVILVAWSRKVRLALFVVLAAIGGTAVDTGLKDIVRRQRPHVFHWPTGASGYSFPSGHSSAAAGFVVVFLCLCFLLVSRKSIKAAATVASVGFALLVGLSRLVLGVHYPTDVVAGLGEGAGIAGLAYLISMHPRTWFRIAIGPVRRARGSAPIP